jgi:hypothetical protein
MKLLILSDALYRIGLKKESKLIYKFSNSLDTWIFNSEEEDSKTVDPESVSNDYSSETKQEDNTYEQPNNLYKSPNFIPVSTENDIWASSILDKSHKIVQRLLYFYNKIWDSIINTNRQISRDDLFYAAKVFRYFDQSFKERMMQPKWIANSGKAITPPQALSIINSSLSDFVLKIPKKDFSAKKYDELREWSYGIYEDYADYYYEYVNPSAKESIIDTATKAVDNAPELSNEELQELRRRFDEGQRRWEQSEGLQWAPEDNQL